VGCKRKFTAFFHAQKILVSFKKYCNKLLDNQHIHLYFKFFNSSDYKKATAVISILFNKPDYVYHKDGKQLWKLNSKEKKLLIKTLKEESGHFSGYTNWDIAKYDWNREYFEEPLNMEKYFNGDYDDIYKNEPSYVPSTLKMPDYTKLNVE
jgi:hypothetical protein